MVGPDQIEWSSGDAALEALDHRWNALAGREPTPFALREWLEPWWQSFGKGLQPLVCRVWRGSELVGGLAMVSTRGRLEEMGNIHTPVLAMPHADAAALASLVTALTAHRAGVVTLGPLPVRGPEVAALGAANQRVRSIARADPARVSPIVDTVGVFEDYLASRGGGWKTLERRRRKMEREHDVFVVAVQVPADGVGFLEEGLEVEASGWKGHAGTAINSQADTASFYRGIASGFARREQLALSGLWLDGRLVAFDLALLFANRYWMLKTGYLESYKHLTPGLVLRRVVVERCFELGLDSHELLGSDQPWKRLFATSDRPHCRWTRYRYLPGPASELAWGRLRYYARPRPYARRVRKAYRALRAR
jgi:CelD/BcsL family acetyltransferase involved in cellulose biosynthesis